MIFSNPQLTTALELAEIRLASVRPGRFIALAVGLAVAYSLFCFCPKLRLLTGPPMDGTFEWTRAITFLEQAKAPLDMSAVREPAMRWRVLPAIVAHGLHLGPAAVWVVPWLGILACLAHAAGTMLRLTGDRTITVLALCLLSGSGGIVTATNLLGINDAGVLLGLNVVAFSPSAWTITVAGLLTPWVDERFLFALPLAVACRTTLAPSTINWTGLVGATTGVVLYLGVRLAWEAAQPHSTSGQYIKDSLGSLGVYWRWIPLGWWMGFRAAWLFILLPLAVARKDCGLVGRWLLWGSSAGALLLITALATDTTRSAQLLTPLLLAGVAGAVRPLGAAEARRWLALAVLANAVMPLSWVTYNKTWPILPLPVELLIFLKG